MASLGGVVVNFMARTRDAIRDVDRFSDSLEDNERAADDLDQALAAAEREFDAIGREAADLTADLRRSDDAFADMAQASDRMADGIRADFQQVSSSVRAGADDIDRETTGVKQSMREAGSEAGAEFIGNIAEGIGSGTANVTEVIQGTLGGLTNLTASLGGPIGIAAGVAAAGIGTVFAATTEAAEKAKAQVKEVVAALVELGETSSATAQQTIWDTWRAGLEDGEKTIGQIADGLRIAGVEQGLFKEAITGSAAAQRDVKAKIADAIAEIEELKEKQGGLGVLDAQRLNALKQVNRQLGVGEDSIDRANDLLTDTELLTGDNERAAEKWADEQRDVYNQTHKIRDELDAIPNSIPVNVIVTMKDKNGRPVKLGPGQLSTPGGPIAAPLAAAMPPVVVNLHTSGITAPESPRQLIDLLETHQVRMGRPRGKPRVLAW